jgi:hypothetical protein
MSSAYFSRCPLNIPGFDPAANCWASSIAGLSRQQTEPADHTKSDWHFTTKDARTKLKHLYPSI